MQRTIGARIIRAVGLACLIIAGISVYAYADGAGESLLGVTILFGLGGLLFVGLGFALGAGDRTPAPVSSGWIELPGEEPPVRSHWTVSGTDEQGKPRRFRTQPCTREEAFAVAERRGLRMVTVEAG